MRYGSLLLASAIAIGAVCAFGTTGALAKSHGVQTPGGREIYKREERFFEVVEHETRRLALEIVTGAAAEGNLGVLVGFLNVPVQNLDLFVGFGQDVTPGQNLAASIRYQIDVAGYRPYVGLGYTYRTIEVGAYSHNVFLELGYKWVLHRTYHLTAGAGFRRSLSGGILDGSLLDAPDLDPILLEEELDDSRAFVPTIALRFSHAF